MTSTLFLGRSTRYNGLPTQSLLIGSNSGDGLTMTNTNFGAYNRKTFAISVWINAVIAGTNIFPYIKFVGTQEFVIALNDTSTEFSTTSPLIDTGLGVSSNNWHHIFAIYDSTQATAANRMSLYVDRTLYTSVSPPALNASVATTTSPVQIGEGNSVAQTVFQPAFFSGTIPTLNQVNNAGHPINVAGLPGLYSLLNTNANESLTTDFIKGNVWTSQNVTKSGTIPS